MSYSSNGNRPKLSEKGLLTPDNCVVALIDHQPQMLFGTSNFDRQGRMAPPNTTRIANLLEAAQCAGSIWHARALT